MLPVEVQVSVRGQNWVEYQYFISNFNNVRTDMRLGSVLQRIIRYSNIRIIEDQIMIFVFVFGPF